MTPIGLMNVTGLRDWARLGGGGINAEGNALLYKVCQFEIDAQIGADRDTPFRSSPIASTLLHTQTKPNKQQHGKRMQQRSNRHTMTTSGSTRWACTVTTTRPRSAHRMPIRLRYSST